MKEPRDYQINALNAIHNGLMEGKTFLLSAIMGAGKTFITCRLIQRYFFETDRNFLILAHKQELVEQFEKTFRNETRIPFHEIGICCSSLGQFDVSKRITIGTVQTVFNKLKYISYVSFLIIDECHMVENDSESQYDIAIKDLQNKNDNLRILGLTATPFRLSYGKIYGNQNLGNPLFDKIGHKITYNELKELGFLMPLAGKVAINDMMELDSENIGVKGDFVMSDASAVMQKEIHLSTCKDAIDAACKEYRHICVFCCDIAHAERVKELLGDECTTVHSQLSQIERYQNMEDWKTGRKRIITSVEILVEGFDFPPLDCLVFARPTLSARLFLQAVGRVLRIHKDKAKAFLLDLTTNTSRFGTDLDKIKIRIPKKVEKQIEEERKFIKECPECGIELHIARVECDCGYEFPMKETVEANSVPNMQEVYFEPEPPKKEAVEYMTFERWQKKGKPDSVRINYHNYASTFPVISKWLCFDHGGYASQVAKEFWNENIKYDTIPETTDEALKILESGDYFRYPDYVILQSDGKYNNLIGYEWPENEREYVDAEILDENPIEEFVSDDDLPF